ncbi:5-hydroxytryptamine receptor 3A-like isoform X2 [Cebidichthys violaceus]|uniref:5-hydroxytryptamine receptor 3A-like isoform X2 n=1 Tax=Cebidichthys violaceus TaxID=271503 RepID=UPI0035CB9B2D
MLRFLTHSLWKAVFLLTLLTVGRGHASCTNRRCLAEMLIEKEYLSQPQNENCTHKISVPLIEYQTLSVDTKTLHIISRLQASLVWRDPELGWDRSVYPYDKVILPVNTIWTPELHVTNGIKTTMSHNSRDLLVNSDGTVEHSVIINAEVNCEVNLFNYPFASDECPVAIQTWSNQGCGTDLVFGKLKNVDGSHGDWRTDNVTLKNVRSDRNYIMVELSIKETNPFITLLLPSILIIIADMVSFALPLGGGERNCFKVTLVLSFTMFLIILNDQLPGDGQCSPVIRIHFCVCLILLVVSMLLSMLLTRLSTDGTLLFSCCCEGSVSGNTGNKDLKEDEEVKADISVIQLNGSEDDSQMLRKVVNFLDALDAKTLESHRYQMFANKVDRTIFWLYFSFGSAYFIAMSCVMIKYPCSVDHFDFWY